MNCRYFAQRLTWFLIVFALININWNQWYSAIAHSPVPNLEGLEIGHHYTCEWSRSSRGKCWLLSCTCCLWSYFYDWWMIFMMPVNQITLFKATKVISRNSTLLHISTPCLFCLSLQHSCHLVWMSAYCGWHDISELTWLTLNGELNAKLSCSCREIINAK